MSSVCGCKEVYRFPHITYPYSSCICSFLQQHPYFLFIKKNIYIYIYIMGRMCILRSYVYFAVICLYARMLLY